MQQKTMSTALMLCIGLLSAGAACAKVPATEADKLGKELTCTGAIKAGNADGSIPPFTGKILGVPPGVKFTKSVGQFQPDIYASEKPLFEITAANMAQYGDKLSDGQKALLKKFPTTMRIPVYPGHRDFRYDDDICAVIKHNALEAEVVNDGNGVKGYMGAIPFPIPKTGIELFWNSMIPSRASTEEVERDMAIVSASGSTAWARTRYVQLSRYDSPENLGKPNEGKYAWVTNFTLLPARWLMKPRLGKAEISRFTELRVAIEALHKAEEQRLMERMDSLETRLQAKVQESENSTAAYVGQLEQQMRGKPNDIL